MELVPLKTGDSKKGSKESESTKLFTVMEFTPDGSELLIGQTNGTIRVLDPVTGKYKRSLQPLQVSYDKSPAVKHLVVSEDGQYFATSDTHNGIAIFKKDATGSKDSNAQLDWIFSGKIRSHDIEITGLCFGHSIDENDQIQHRLFSIGADRKCFEYNIRDAKLSTLLPV